MQCPVCKDAKLSMTERQGIEVDYCPDCRGVWLDRGELDKIIERSVDDAGSQTDSATAGGGDHGKRKKKKEGLLGELLDF